MKATCGLCAINRCTVALRIAGATVEAPQQRTQCDPNVIQRFSFDDPLLREPAPLGESNHIQSGFEQVLERYDEPSLESPEASQTRKAFTREVGRRFGESFMSGTSRV